MLENQYLQGHSLINNERPIDSHKKDVASIVLKCICMVYFILGICLCVSDFETRISVLSDQSKRSSVNQYPTSRIVHLVIHHLFNIITVFNIGFIIYAKYLNYKHRDLVSKSMIDKRILYVIALPMLISSLIHMIVSFFYNTGADKGTVTGKDELIILSAREILPFIQILFFVSVFVLMSESRKMAFTRDNSHLKVINTSVLLVTIVGIFNHLIYSSYLKMIENFKITAGKYYNISFDKVLNGKIYQEQFSIERSLFPSIISFSVIALIYFVNPFKRYLLENDVLIGYSVLSTLTEVEVDINTSVHESSDSGKITGLSLILSAFIIISSIFMFPVYVQLYILFPITTNIGRQMQIGVMSLPMVTSLKAIGLLIILLKASKTWPAHNFHFTAEKLFLWIGFCGVALGNINLLSMGIEPLKTTNLTNGVLAECIVRILFSMVSCTFICLQTIVIDITCTKKPGNVRIHTKIGQLQPIFLLFSINLSLFMLEVGQMVFLNNLESSNFPVELFQKQLKTISIPFSIIFRLYSLFYFWKMIKTMD